MGLAPSEHRRKPWETIGCEVPVPIFSQPLRVPNRTRSVRSTFVSRRHIRQLNTELRSVSR